MHKLHGHKLHGVTLIFRRVNREWRVTPLGCHFHFYSGRGAPGVMKAFSRHRRAAAAISQFGSYDLMTSMVRSGETILGRGERIADETIRALLGTDGKNKEGTE